MMNVNMTRKTRFQNLFISAESSFKLFRETGKCFLVKNWEQSGTVVCLPPAVRRLQKGKQKMAPPWCFLISRFLNTSLSVFHLGCTLPAKLGFTECSCCVQLCGMQGFEKVIVPLWVPSSGSR